LTGPPPAGGSVVAVNLAAIPSPTTSVWHVFGVPVRAYALCIVLGIVAAVLIMEYRLRNRGVAHWASLDMSVWAVPFGIIGGRIYHVISSPQAYFGEGGDPLRAFAIWEGGLGIWGAIALGGVGAWIACRRKGIPLPAFVDALAPGLLVAQAIGRLGNWFNNELYGGPTDLPWGLTIYEWANGRALSGPDGEPVVLGTFHPTFLYELLWNLAAAALVIWADRRFRLGHGRAFALYVVSYCLGRLWIELMRTDPAETFFGVRLNVFTSVVVGLLALAYFFWQRGRPREVIDRGGRTPEASAEAAAEPAPETDRPPSREDDHRPAEPG